MSALYPLQRARGLIAQGQATGEARRGITDGSEEKSSIRLHPPHIRRRQEEGCFMTFDRLPRLFPLIHIHTLLCQLSLLRSRALLLCRTGSVSLYLLLDSVVVSTSLGYTISAAPDCIDTSCITSLSPLLTNVLTDDVYDLRAYHVNIRYVAAVRRTPCACVRHR